MDYTLQLIGLIVVVMGGTSPDVSVNTAFAPRWQAGMTFCCGTREVPEHTVFIRVADSAVDPSQTSWAGQKPCHPSQQCMLFPITTPSEIKIDPGFIPTATSTAGTTFNILPRLGEGEPSLKLVSRPESVAAATLKMPGGRMEARKLVNGTAITWVRVFAPASTPLKPITIQAIPNGGGTTQTLVVSAGTMINVVNLPPDHSGLDLNMTSPDSPPHADHLHYYLVNALLPNAYMRCKTPQAPDLDPLCSNQGCCP